MIMAKTSVMWVTIPLNLSSRSFIPFPRFIKFVHVVPHRFSLPSYSFSVTPSFPWSSPFFILLKVNTHGPSSCDPVQTLRIFNLTSKSYSRTNVPYSISDERSKAILLDGLQIKIIHIRQRLFTPSQGLFLPLLPIPNFVRLSGCERVNKGMCGPQSWES